MMLPHPLSLFASRFCLLLPAFIAVGCLQEESVDPTLPTATQTGLNTAGCRVDDIIWTASSSDPFGGKAIYIYWAKLPSAPRFPLSIHLRHIVDDEREVHAQTSISLYVPDIRSTGTFELNQTVNPALSNPDPAYASFSFDRPRPTQLYRTGPTATGRLIVTRFDTVARIVAGTFEFTAERANAPTVRVSEGRFDLKFK